MRINKIHGTYPIYPCPYTFCGLDLRKQNTRTCMPATRKYYTRLCVWVIVRVGGWLVGWAAWGG